MDMCYFNMVSCYKLVLQMVFLVVVVVNCSLRPSTPSTIPASSTWHKHFYPKSSGGNGGDSSSLVHRFFDTNPISPCGRYLAATRMPHGDFVSQQSSFSWGMETGGSTGAAEGAVTRLQSVDIVIIDLDTDEERVVLLFDFDRPMRFWGKVVHRSFVAALKRTAYFLEPKKNLPALDARLEAAIKRADSMADSFDDQTV